MLLDPYRFAVAGGAFDPLDLFAGSEIGGWWDVQDLSTLFEERVAPTTTPAVGDPVGTMNDKSGNGNHLVAPGDTQRPILRQDGSGFYYLEFDGSNDLLSATFALSQPWHRFSVLLQDTWTNADCLLGGGSGTAGCLQQNASSPNIRLFQGSAGVNINALAVDELAVVYEKYGGTGNEKFRKNLGSLVDAGSLGSTAPNGFTIGAIDSTGPNYGNVHYYGGLVWSDTSTITLSDENNIINYLGDLCGVTV